MAWKVLYVRPRSEKKLAEYAEVFEARYYLPLRRETKVYQRRKVVVDKPLFPGYFFASMEKNSEFRKNALRHILQEIEPSDERKLLHQLAQVRKALRVDPTLAATKALHKGKRVMIENGPFAGIEGVVWSIRANTKVRLNVEMVGQAVIVEADASYLVVME